MDTPPKRTGKQVGLAALNLLFVLLILFGVQFLIRGRINNTAGLAILSLLVFAADLAGHRFIERCRPPELAGLLSLKQFFGGLAVGVALFSGSFAFTTCKGREPPPALVPVRSPLSLPPP